MAITIYTPPGIGDAYWALMRIIPNTDEEVIIKTCSHTNNPAVKTDTRAKFLEYVNGVSRVEVGDYKYPEFQKISKEKYPTYKKIEPVMFLDTNVWLEQGRRIENYLPFLPITGYKLDWQVSQNAKDYVTRLLKPRMKNIVIYTSAAQNNANNGSVGPLWRPRHWVEVIDKLYEEYGNELNLVWIGATYDETMLPLLKKFKRMITLVQKPPDVVLHLIQNSDAFISFQSGLSVLSVCYGVPTFMLYFKRLDKLRYTFGPPAAMGGHSLYHAPFFETVGKNTSMPVEWLRSIL